MALLRKKLLNLLLIIPVIFNLSGCVYLVVGGIGALGGYIVSPDTIEGITERDEKTVFDTSVEVISIMGLIVEKQEEAGIIMAKVGTSRITIQVISLNTNATKLSIKARKMFLPKISLAQDIYVKIMSQVGE